jgi:uncharacterized membrane protein YdjX (TVP38/TMEM64 family)
VLANVSRRLRGRFSRRRLESLAAAEEALAGDRRKELGGLLLFALSPVPSAQLFVAAGLLEVRLVPLTLAFFAGRLVSYSIYVSGASLAKHSIEHTLTAAFSSWWGITLQVVMLAGVVALVRVDWTRVLARPAAGMRSRG